MDTLLPSTYLYISCAISYRQHIHVVVQIYISCLFLVYPFFMVVLFLFILHSLLPCAVPLLLFLTSLVTQSSHLSRGLPLLLLPSSRHPSALLVRRSSAVLFTCPAHFSRFFRTLSPLSIHPSSSPAIRRTQLFSHNCRL